MLGGYKPPSCCKTRISGFSLSEQKWKSGPWRLYLDSDYSKLEGGERSVQAKQALACLADVNKIAASKVPTSSLRARSPWLGNADLMYL